MPPFTFVEADLDGGLPVLDGRFDFIILPTCSSTCATRWSSSARSAAY